MPIDSLGAFLFVCPSEVDTTPRVQISALTLRRAGLGSGWRLWAEEADTEEGVGKRALVSFTEMTGWAENVGRDAQLLVCSNRGLWSTSHLDIFRGW